MQIIGHRGARGLEPENTLKSIQKAIDLGVFMVEIDARFCKDEVIVIHDRTLDRTTNGSGYFLDIPYEKIRSLDAGKGEVVPTLREVLNLVAGKAEINVEIKETHSVERICDVVKDVVSSSSLSIDDVLFTSFDNQILLNVRQRFPKVRIGILAESKLILMKETIEAVSAYSYNSGLELTDKDLVDQVHSYGCKSIVYTVNEKADYELMKSIGVDAVFCDFPDRYI